MWETAAWLFVLLTAPGQVLGLDADEALKRPSVIKGERLALTGLAEKLQSATQRGVAVSPYVPAQRVFVASPGEKTAKVMEAVAEVLSTSEYQYQWRRSGVGDTRAYLLSRISTNPQVRVREASQRFNRALAAGPRYVQKPENQLTAGDAVPARFQLLRSMPPAILNNSLRTALSGRRVLLPLTLFDRNTLMAATGGVTVGSGSPDRRKATITFSSQEIARGNGYVSLERSNLRDGNFGLRLSIGSGTPPPEGRPVVGPSTDIIGSTEKDQLRMARFGSMKTNLVPPMPPPVKRKRLTIRHDRSLKNPEDALPDVLAQLAEQSGYAVVARWPEKSKLALRRLPASIIDQPLDEALNIIATHYGLRAESDDPALRFIPR